MTRKLLMITFVLIIIFNVVNGMVLSGWNTYLDLLYQKSIRYQHHRENYVTSLLEGFTPSGLRINKRPAFKAVSDTFEGEWNSIWYDTEKRLVELLLKESEEAVSVVEAEIHVEIERSDSTNEILEDLEKKHKEYKEQLENRRKKKWSQIRFREANTAISYKYDFKHQERRNSVQKSTDLGVELNKEKTATVHNARENKGKEGIGRNVESKSGNEFIKMKSIENVLCCNNIRIIES